MSLLTSFRTQKDRDVADDRSARREYVEILNRAGDPKSGDGEKLYELAERLGYKREDVERDASAAERLADLNRKIDAAEKKMAGITKTIDTGKAILADVQRQVKIAENRLNVADDKMMNATAKKYAAAAAAGVVLTLWQCGTPGVASSFAKAHGWQYAGHNPLNPVEGQYRRPGANQFNMTDRPIPEPEVLRILAAVEIGSVKDQVMAQLHRAADVGDFNAAVDGLVKD